MKHFSNYYYNDDSDYSGVTGVSYGVERIVSGTKKDRITAASYAGVS
jgi:hypothetical protein